MSPLHATHGFFHGNFMNCQGTNDPLRKQSDRYHLTFSSLADWGSFRLAQGIGKWFLAIGARLKGTRLRDEPQESIFSALMKACCGISTFPNWRIFFFPAFCLSSSLRLRVASPP